MAIAEATLSEILQAQFDNDPVVVSASGTATPTILAGRAGFRAAVLGYTIKSTGANSVQFKSGDTPDDISGDISVANAEEIKQLPKDLLILQAAEGEDLKVTYTIGGGSLEGHINVGYVKVR